MSQSDFNNVNKISINELSPEIQLILQMATGSGEALEGIYPGATKTENIGNGKIKINDVEVTVYSHPTTHPVSMITGLHSVATSGQYSDLVGVPTSLPASDVYEWAKASTKPTYSPSDVGAIALNTRGVSNGVATLNSSAKLPLEQLHDNLYDLAFNDKLPDRQMPDNISISKLINDEGTTIIFGGLSSALVPLV